MNRLCFFLSALLLAVTASAQMADPVHFTSQLTELSDGEAEIVFTARIDDGWHVYSTRLGDGGPISATFNAVTMDGVETVGELKPRGQEQQSFDRLFGMQVRYFEHAATFVQRIRITKPRYVIDCYLEYGACNDQMCLPPQTAAFKTTHEPAAAPEPAAAKADTAAAAAAADTAAAQPVEADTAATDTPVIAVPAALPTEGAADAGGSSLLFIFGAGLLAGLLALLTPCVWPIIPMTVSFFLKRNKEHATAIREAVVYGLSIIVIYVLLGLLVTLLFGANALNALSTNAWFNIFFALLLVVFAASFMGAFELTLPASWSDAIDRKADQLGSKGRGGVASYLSIFLMAFTLALVSFSCTGPIVGVLLVAVSTQGELLGPTVGMLGFAIGLAVPFAFFAMFPSLLSSMPKSGGWMNTVKVTLGFVELAFALKFLSVADLAYGWHLLDRDVFIALWIVIFGLLGAYLLGWLHLGHEGRQPAGLLRRLGGIAVLLFTLYMVPGLLGAPLKAISAFTPPMYTQHLHVLSGVSVEARFRDYDEGMRYAREHGQPVVLDFTGFGCVNCRKMEGAVWTDDEVASRLTDDFVLISLYVDDKTPLPQPDEVSVGGQQRTLRTVGDRWSHLQAAKFGANTQPYYVVLTPDERPLGPVRSYDEDVDAYLRWLDDALRQWKQQNSK